MSVMTASSRVARRVADAMTVVPREGFLPPTDRENADYDGPIPIGSGQTNSQPRTVAAMLELLDVQPGMRVLDVGAGSGWTTALLAHLTGPGGSVVGVERLAEVAGFGAANLDRTGMPWARLDVASSGVLGAPKQAPFDRILVSAGATRLPQALLDQLAPGGVLVVPVDGIMHRALRRTGDGDAAADGRERHTDDDVEVTTHGAYRFVPLVED